jgi:hypothetical protein
MGTQSKETVGESAGSGTTPSCVSNVFRDRSAREKRRKNKTPTVPTPENPFQQRSQFPDRQHDPPDFGQSFEHAENPNSGEFSDYRIQPNT